MAGAATSGGQAPIEAHGLSKTYRFGFWFSRKVVALEGLDLRVEPGEVYGLLGPNGAGKSTTLKILLNLVQPTMGSASLFGLPPRNHQSRAAIGFVPENPTPYDYLSGREFVTLAGHLSGLDRHAASERAKEVLAQVDLSGAADLQLRRYSKGMIQRVTVAQALVARPKLLILDEPTSGLDPVGRRLMRDLILAERARGTTILFCTHIISDVEAVCDRVCVLVGGKKVREGGVRELLTAQEPIMELTVEEITPEVVRAFGLPLQSVTSVGSRVVVRANDVAMQGLLKQLTARGTRITQLNAVHFSMEDMFMRALEEAGARSTKTAVS